jgi:hypothetical protein
MSADEEPDQVLDRRLVAGKRRLLVPIAVVQHK